MEVKKRKSFGKALTRFARKSTTNLNAAAPIPVSVSTDFHKGEGFTSPTSTLCSTSMSGVSPSGSDMLPSPVSSFSVNKESTTKWSSNHTGARHMRDMTSMSDASTAMSRFGHSSSSSEDNNNSSIINNGVSQQQESDGGNSADILLNRLLAYRTIIKNLQQHFTELMLLENSIVKAMNKAANAIVVPFKDGEQFRGQGGLQDVCVGIRDSVKSRAEEHANAAQFVEENVVKHLRRLKQEVKSRIRAMKADSSLYSPRLGKEREATQERIASLAKAIGLFELAGSYQPDMEKVHLDPYVINISLRVQLARQIQEESQFSRSLKQCQEQLAEFEFSIINELKQILVSFAGYQSNHAEVGFTQSWAQVERALNFLDDDTEWNTFLESNAHRFLPTELSDADPEKLDYPCKDSQFLIPIKTGHMSRQSSVLKSWKDGYFVLTPAGWLHVFSSADEVKNPVPERSIYVPTAILGPHTEPGQKGHIFSLEGKGLGGLLHRDNQTFTVRARSREEMLAWWSECSKRAHYTTYTQQGDGSLEAPKRSETIRTRPEPGPVEPEPAPEPAAQRTFEPPPQTSAPPQRQFEEPRRSTPPPMKTLPPPQRCSEAPLRSGSFQRQFEEPQKSAAPHQRLGQQYFEPPQRSSTPPQRYGQQQFEAAPSKPAAPQRQSELPVESAPSQRRIELPRKSAARYAPPPAPELVSAPARKPPKEPSSRHVELISINDDPEDDEPTPAYAAPVGKETPPQSKGFSRFFSWGRQNSDSTTADLNTVEHTVPPPTPGVPLNSHRAEIVA
ncbi:hypothetical protein BG011_001620 [Mortierella polycephala]|uniref:PH domain-containing protein n=1 Tax=Mortierella polycephala TaxID=41804 RepID=A0A9P6Q8D8_9FUNG|nr:hypothetical protein BG011_001620 [Mortierella polycephala]